jgi:trk system potassium uptake protein TrkA
MRVSIVGAGNVGRYIARELARKGHEVLVIDKNTKALAAAAAPGVETLSADACELDSLTGAHLETCDVAIAATGDDKANLVHSLLAKTEFGVPRTVGRVNRPDNEWLFSGMWGVDVAVSTPRIMCALAEEAVTIGHVVRLFGFNRGDTSLVEMTLPQSSPHIGHVIGEIHWPADIVLVALIRDGRGLAPVADVALESADELLFLASSGAEEALTAFLTPTDASRVADFGPLPDATTRPGPETMLEPSKTATDDDLDEYVL